ncbi:hypothetical protein FOA52_014290 [Chlamydomonas sp. UWO 241]|nr:hypothetical protein FOA52_014290 [Chlamydomonas sp. UWO 241]
MGVYAEGVTNTLRVLQQGTLEVWGSPNNPPMRAFLKSGSELYRLVNWEEYKGTPGFGTGAVVSADGYVITAQVLPLINLMGLSIVEPSPQPIACLYNASEAARLREEEQGGGRRRLQAVVKPDARVLVVRVSLASGCSPVRSTQPGCSSTEWLSSMFSAPNSVMKHMSTCSFGAMGIDQAASAIRSVEVPCTPLASTADGYCGDESYKWRVDAGSVLQSQGVNLGAYDHVIYDMPSLGCGWSGIATMPGAWVMMNSNCGAGTALHELGHNYGTDHSDVMVGSTIYEYGDYGCVMGAATDNGKDNKCWSLAWTHALGVSTPRQISTGQLPPGGTMTATIGVVWRDKSNGIVIDAAAFGGPAPRSYYILLQADAGPMSSLKNMYLYAGSGIQPVLYHKAVVIQARPYSYSNDDAVRLAVLGGNSWYELPGTGIVVRPLSFTDNGDAVTITLCRKGGAQQCGASDTPLAPQRYWKFRPASDLQYCLSVCMDSSGQGCQPSGLNTNDKRLAVMRKGCGNNDVSNHTDLWYWDGLLLRNKQTNMCLDPEDATNYANPGPLYVRPCASNDGLGSSPIQQMWMWGGTPGSQFSMPEQAGDYFEDYDQNRFVSRWTQTYVNLCPAYCTSNACTALMGGPEPDVVPFAFTYGGSGVCSSRESTFELASALSFTAEAVNGAAVQPVASPPPRTPPPPFDAKADCERFRDALYSASLSSATALILCDTVQDGLRVNINGVLEPAQKFVITMLHTTPDGAMQVWARSGFLSGRDFWNRLFWVLKAKCACSQFGELQGSDRLGAEQVGLHSSG